MVGSETNAVLCNLNMNPGCKVYAPQKLIQWSGRSRDRAENGLSVCRHIEVAAVVVWERCVNERFKKQEERQLAREVASSLDCSNYFTRNRPKRGLLGILDVDSDSTEHVNDSEPAEVSILRRQSMVERERTQ